MITQDQCVGSLLTAFSGNGWARQDIFWLNRGGSRIFFRRGCTRLLLYFNTNKPHTCFFLQNTSCIRKPQVISGVRGGGVRTPCTLPLDPPLLKFIMIKSWKINTSFHASREAEFKELINGVYSAIKIHYRFTGFWTKTRS